MTTNQRKQLDRNPEHNYDPVNSPHHYTYGGIETIDFIQAKLTAEEFIGFLRGNCIKYIGRLGAKGNVVEDAKKLQWYVNKLIQSLEGNESK